MEHHPFFNWVRNVHLNPKVINGSGSGRWVSGNSWVKLGEGWVDALASLQSETFIFQVGNVELNLGLLCWEGFGSGEGILPIC